VRGNYFADLPLAAQPLKSYRLRGPFGLIMIGAKDDADAMVQAARSTPNPKADALERWNGLTYVPCRNDSR